MAAGTAPIFAANSKTAAVQIVNADGAGVANAKLLVTAGADGCIIYGIEASSDDTAVIDVGLFLQLAGSGTKYPLGAKRVAIRSGDPTNANAAAATQILDVGQFPFLLPDGALMLGASDKLYAAPQAAVTSGKTLTLVAMYGDYS